jgi:pimeloyl-ACP methyl ester carboxylesterase
MTVRQTDFGTVEILEFGPAAADSLVVMLHATATGAGSLIRLAKALAEAGYRTVIPALHRYGATRVEAALPPLDRNLCVARWVLDEFAAPRIGIFGQSMGGLTAVLTALAPGRPINRLMVYEPMVLRALDPNDAVDMRERDWDRSLVRAVADAVGTDGFEAATAAFIEAWNEAAWSDIPPRTRAAILEDGPGLAAEMLAVNEGVSSASALESLAVPTLLLGGDRSPPLAGRILDRLGHHLPESRREILHGLGHMGPVMAPSRVAESLVRFLG